MEGECDDLGQMRRQISECRATITGLLDSECSEKKGNKMSLTTFTVTYTTVG